MVIFAKKNPIQMYGRQLFSAPIFLEIQKITKHLSPPRFFKLRTSNFQEFFKDSLKA